MTGSAVKPRTGGISFALGLLVAAISVMVGHYFLIVVLAASFDTEAGNPFGSRLLQAGIPVVILAGVLYGVLLTFRNKTKRPLELSIGKAISWTFVFVLAFCLASGQILLQDFSFSSAHGWFALIHAVPAIPLALALITIGIVLHRLLLRSLARMARLA